MKFSEVVMDLLERCNSPHLGHYHSGLELQIEPVDETTANELGYVSTVFKYRIPKNGSTDPTDNDRSISYPQNLFYRVGTSGWNWREKRSEFAIFDFDSQHGHKEGLTEDDLRRVQDAASTLPYVQVHRSKSGRGLHFYVQLEGHVDHLHARIIASLRKQSSFKCRRTLASISQKNLTVKA